MARGGKRPGAGRRKGARNVRTRELARKAAEEGITPLDVMLKNMRWADGQADEVLAKIMDGQAEGAEGVDALKELMNFRAMAQNAAKDAAPYIHPRLAAIEHTGKDGESLNMGGLATSGEIEQARRVAFALGRILERQRLKVIEAKTDAASG